MYRPDSWQILHYDLIDLKLQSFVWVGFGHMTRELMSLADGKIVLALEGGYEMTAICDSVEMCMKALQGLEIPPIKEEELMKTPCKSAIETLENTINIQSMWLL